MPTLLSRLLPVLLVSCVASDDTTAPLPDEPTPSTDPDEPSPDPGESETPAQLAERLIMSWQDCMQLEDFQAARMSPTWSQLPTQNGATCAHCHADGAGGFIATASEQTFFDALKTNRYHLLQYVTVDVPGARMVVNRTIMPGVAAAQAPHAEHPRFDPTAGMAALDQWYQLAAARLASECMPSPE